MTFLHWSILFAYSAVAVPIVIHLLNRRSAKIVDWGAMQFLLGSLVSRKRRVLLDEILLLGARCLLVALVVTALARPVIPAGSSIAWAVVLPIVLVGSVALGVGTAFWRQRRWRWICYGVGAGLLTLALLAIALEHVLHLGTLIGQSRDMVLVIDGSSSTTIEVDGKSNFTRAVDEARGLINALHGTATVSIVLAGPVPEVKTPVPMTDPAQLNAILDELRPAGGILSLHDALRTAALILSTANNATKQIVLVTDGQKAGWDPADRELWELTAQESRTVQGVQPQIYCRVLDVPAKLRNVAVTELAASRKIVGTDRPLLIRARLANGGQMPVAPSVAYLSVDGKTVDRQPVGQLEPGASETLTFSHRFDAPGPHVVEIKSEAADDLPEDNRRAIAVHVLDHLPVLVINGRSDPRPLDRAAAFVQLALDPESLARGNKPRDAKSSALVRVTVVDLDRVNSVREWEKYHVVVLADVGELPRKEADEIANFVVRGGGLLILPGTGASQRFYNAWNATIDGSLTRLLPASLQTRTALPADSPAVYPEAASLTHASLQQVRDARSDLDLARLAGYWQLEVDPGRPSLVAGRLNNSAPWLVEQTLGQGRVLLAASAFDLRDGSLPTRQAFLPLVHGLVYHLAEDAQWELNRQPGRHIAFRFPASLAVPPQAAGTSTPSVPQLPLASPDGSPIETRSRIEKQVLTVDVDHLSMPGVYRLAMPETPAAKAAGLQDGTVPVAVPADAAESSIEWLTDADLEKVRAHLAMERLSSAEDLQAIAAGRTHGIELWKSLVFLALLLVVGEVVLTWWIALSRIPDADKTIDFTNRATSVTFREELEKLRDAEADDGETIIDLIEAGG